MQNDVKLTDKNKKLSINEKFEIIDSIEIEKANLSDEANKIEFELEKSLPSESLVASLEQSLCKTRTFKIIILGNSGVGKTCLATRLCQGEFSEKSDPTIGVDFRHKNLLIKNELVKLQIWDTAGQERYRKSMIPHFYRNVNAVVFVYDVTNLSSFEDLVHWIHESESYHLKDDVLRIIIGNKCDIEPHMVQMSMAQRFADRYYMPLFETSAKDKSQTNYIDSIFITLAHKLMNSKKWLPRQFIPNVPLNLPRKRFSFCSC